MPASSLKRERSGRNRDQEKATGENDSRHEVLLLPVVWFAGCPLPLALWPPSAFLELTDAIAEPSRILISLAGDRLVQLLAQLNQLRLGLLVLRQPPRRLAAMADLAMDILQQRTQFLAKFLIIVWTTQPAGVTKFHKLDAAHGAFALV